MVSAVRYKRLVPQGKRRLKTAAVSHGGLRRLSGSLLRQGDRYRHTADEHLFVQPQRILGQHGELLVRNGVQIHAGKIMAHVDHPLADTLLVRDAPPVYKFTSMLWRVVISSES